MIYAINFINFRKLLATLICFNCIACSSSPKWVSVPKYQRQNMNYFTGNRESKSSVRPLYEVAPGNIIEIKSPDTKVNGDYRIQFDNTLKLPYDVVIYTASMTEDQLTKMIRDSYGRYFRNPSDVRVSINKNEYLVNIKGLIKKPGDVIVKSNTSLDEIIAQAGGLQESSTPDKGPKYASISGAGSRNVVKLSDYYSGAKSYTFHWQGGETIFLQTEVGSDVEMTSIGGNSIQVLGQVKNPGDYGVEKDGNFFTYLVKSGGPTNNADLTNIMLIRNTKDQTRALTFNMQNITTIPEIYPGDTIIFNADTPTSLEKKSRVGANFASIVSAIGIIIAIALI